MKPGDLAGAFLAVAATNCREVNFQVGQDAKRRGNSGERGRPERGKHLLFPRHLYAGSGLVAGVVSQGEEHKKTAAAARKIRTVLEELE